MKLGKTIFFYIIFLIVSLFTSVILSCIGANIIYLIYASQDEILLMQDLLISPNIMINRLYEIQAVGQMFWIFLSMFGVLIFMANYKRWFGLKDYKSNTYKVTNEIEIPIRVGNKQTQQGSSWWLSSKEYSKVFRINTLDCENKTIKKLLYNADKETKIIKNIEIPYIKKSDKEEIDITELKKRINIGYSKLKSIDIPKEESKVFEKGGIALGKRNRKVLGITQTFPFIKLRTVEDIYYVGENVHTLTVGATRSGKTRNLVIESIYNCALAGESMVISDPKGELFEYTSRRFKTTRL